MDIKKKKRYIPNHEETLVQGDRGKEKYRGEDSLRIENKNCVMKLLSWEPYCPQCGKLFINYYCTCIAEMIMPLCMTN